MDDERYYLPCPLKKNRGRVAVTVCHKRRCMFLESEEGNLRCGYKEKMAPKRLFDRPKVTKIERDGVI